MEKVLVGIGITIFSLIVLFIGYITFFPSGRALINNYNNMMHKVDDITKYETRN